MTDQNLVPPKINSTDIIEQVIEKTYQIISNISDGIQAQRAGY